MNRHYAQVAERARHRCEYYHAREAIFNLPFEVEHIVPTSRGGPDDKSNLALACRACNVYKSDQLSGVDEATRELIPLFHPRRDHWEAHFRVESADGSIQARNSNEERWPPGSVHRRPRVGNDRHRPTGWDAIAMNRIFGACRAVLGILACDDWLSAVSIGFASPFLRALPELWVLRYDG